VDHYEKVRDEVKLASGDYIDLKMYEPAMRHLIDTYIRAEESEKISAFDDLTWSADRRARRGAVDALPKGIRKNQEAVAETIENNVRKLIIDEMAVNPKYYEKMSELLDALIEQRKQEALDYAASGWRWSARISRTCTWRSTRRTVGCAWRCRCAPPTRRYVWP
jgi:type I restriction enzyme, R subunit